MHLRHPRLPAPGDLGDDTRWAWVREQGMEGGTRHGAKRRHELSEMARSDPETEAGVEPLGQRFPTISLNWR